MTLRFRFSFKQTNGQCLFLCCLGNIREQVRTNPTTLAGQLQYKRFPNSCSQYMPYGSSVVKEE